jgi:hypothetical protein
MTLNPRALSDILDAVDVAEQTAPLPAAPRTLRPRKRPAAEAVPAETGLRVTASERHYDSQYPNYSLYRFLMGLGQRIARKAIDHLGAKAVGNIHIRETNDGRAWVLVVRWDDADGHTRDAEWVAGLRFEVQAALPDAKVELCRWEAE